MSLKSIFNVLLPISHYEPPDPVSEEEYPVLIEAFSIIAIDHTLSINHTEF